MVVTGCVCLRISEEVWLSPGSPRGYHMTCMNAMKSKLVLYDVNTILYKTVYILKRLRFRHWASPLGMPYADPADHEHDNASNGRLWGVAVSRVARVSRSRSPGSACPRSLEFPKPDPAPDRVAHVGRSDRVIAIRGTGGERTEFKIRWWG